MAFAGGTGIQQDPYLVATASQLDEVRNNLTAYYKQTADIDLTSIVNWNPIGTTSSAFQGTYDGNNFKITNLKITGKSNAGLFCYGQNATFKNINIINATITGGTDGCAILLYKSETCTLTNCHVSGTVSITNNFASGLVANVGIIFNGYTNIDNCSADSVTITGFGYVGGLVGNSNNANIINSYAKGSINGIQTTGGKYIGGLGGCISGFSSYRVNVQNCYFEGNVNAPADIDDYHIQNVSIGGFIGQIGTAVDIKTSYAKGSVTCGLNIHGGSGGSNGDGVGGFIGQMNGGSITDCYAIVNVTGGTMNSVGGYIGWTFAGESLNIINCFAVGTCTAYFGGTNIGGFNRCGATSNITFTNCFYDSSISGKSDTGRGTPKTTTEMKTQSTFAGYDFTNKWAILPDYNSGYPELKFNILPDFDVGDGTAGNPYRISTQIHLNNVRKHLSSYFIIISDLDMSTYTNWTPIGTENSPFTGYIDGNSCLINNLTINMPTSDYVGLFGYAVNATFLNLILTNTNIIGKDNTGTLLGYGYYSINNNTPYINNCMAYGLVNGNEFVGGVTGQINSNGITNLYLLNKLYSNVNITAKNKVGGIVGYGSCGLLQSGSIGSIIVDTTSSYVGGIAGILIDIPSCIDGCFSGCSISNGQNSIGSMVGIYL